MAGKYFYHVTALPALGDLGSAPPMRLADLWDHVRDAPGPLALIEAIFLGDDLLQRDAVLAGETQEVAPVVLTPGQVRNEEPLPAFLAVEAEAAEPRAAVDAVWAAYFRHAADVARREASRFLGAWVAHEVALRNALATARAKALALEPADYLVTPDLGEDADGDFPALVSEWASAPTPLEGQKVLDRARWDWLSAREEWFSFGATELAAYAAKLMLLVRWHRLSQAPLPPGD